RYDGGVKAWAIIIGTLFVLAAAACGTEPQLASPASQSGFAENYATELDSVGEDITEAESRAKKIIGEMPSYPDKLKGAPLDKVLRVIDASDADGRSRTYVERFRQVEAAYGFYNLGQEAIAKKFGDKLKGCTPDAKPDGKPEPKTVHDKDAKDKDK